LPAQCADFGALSANWSAGYSFLLLADNCPDSWWTDVLGSFFGGLPQYLEVCRQAGALCPDSRRALSGIQGVLKQRRSSFEMDYVCDTSYGPVSFHMDVTPISFKSARAAINQWIERSTKGKISGMVTRKSGIR
jgi:hypothetical protein